MEQLLIVEDDIGLNQGLCKALKVDDRKIISCQDLKTAKEQLLCGGVSLILLDINLPDGSGLELLREVKELRKRDGTGCFEERSKITDEMRNM